MKGYVLAMLALPALITASLGGFCSPRGEVLSEGDAARLAGGTCWGVLTILCSESDTHVKPEEGQPPCPCQDACSESFIGPPPWPNTGTVGERDPCCDDLNYIGCGHTRPYTPGCN